MIRIGIAAESAAELPPVRLLVDRCLARRLDWFADIEDCLRVLEGIDGAAFLDLHQANDLARARRLPLFGHFHGEPGAPDARMLRAALMLFADQESPPDAVILRRDVDDEPERLRALEQARNDTPEDGAWPFPVLGALAVPELEAWLISAWAPETPDEETRHARIRQRLGFDPVTCAHQLTAKRAHHPKDAKRVLRELCTSGRLPDDRWATLHVERLTQLGQHTGLATFIAEIDDALLPLFVAGPRLG